MDNHSIENPFDADERKRGMWVRLVSWISLGAIILGCCALSVFATVFNQLDLNSLFLPPTPALELTSNVFEAAAISAGDQWQLAISDSFDDNNEKLWYVGTDDNQYLKITYEVKDGKYRWDATAHQGFIQSMLASNKTFTDFFVTMEAQAIGDPAFSDYGILFREDGLNNYYYFGVSNTGEFIVLLNNQGIWSNLLGPTASSLIQIESANRLAVMGEGPHFTFFVNDRYVGEITDNHLPRGKIGLAIQLYEADDKSIFEFDRVEIRTPPLPATVTPSPRPTSTTTHTPTLTLTPHVLVPASESAEVFNEKFDSNANSWDSFYTENTTDIRDGKLYLKSDNAGFVAIAICSGCPRFGKRFYFQAEVVPEEKFYTEHGIAFCSEAQTHYVFAINSVSQIYSVYKRLLTDWEIVFSNTPSQFINKYPASNTLAVEYDQGKMKLYINGNVVNTHADPDPPDCKTFGVYIDDGPLNLITDNIYAYEIRGTPVPTLTP